LDVADEGGDKNSLAHVKGVTLKYIEEWAEGDTGDTARKAVGICKERKINELQYDCIGVGAGVKSETNRLKKEGKIPKALRIVKWNGAKGPLYPNGHVVSRDKETPLNKDFYANLKAQGWWRLRIRFEKTFKAVTQGVEYPVSELISLPTSLGQILHKVVDELSQPTYGRNGAGKIVINKKPEGAKSPNLADSVVIAYWPVRKQKVHI
jgi:hypothetical protein